VDCRSLSTAGKRGGDGAKRWFSPPGKSVQRLRRRQGSTVDPAYVDVEVLDSTEQDGLDSRNRLGTWSYFTRSRAKLAQTRKPLPPERFANSPDASPTHAAPGGPSAIMNRSASTSL
jgi:hypothetical protein